MYNFFEIMIYRIAPRLRYISYLLDCVNLLAAVVVPVQTAFRVLPRILLVLRYWV